MVTILSVFSERLKEQRQNSGKKQTEVAALLGVQLRSYQAYEEGAREPNYEKLVLLAKYFQTSTDYLLGVTDRA